ncbi:MAG: helicase C-terminal domain-containing protein, partial [Nanoarchaeota archaeon]
LLDSLELQSEILIDETNYANNVLEAVENFKESFKDTYLTYKKEEDNLYVNIVNTDLAKKFNEIVEKNKAVILMSGTLHSASVMKNIFGAKDFATVEAETLNQGNIEIVRTGKEFDCRYSNFQNGTNNREDYLHALSYVIERSVKPTLVHVNAFSDLPTREETEKFDVGNLKTKEELIKEQYDDRDGRKIQMFRDGLVNSLFTTKCSRGVDFPGKMCNSVVFTKFPNPNVRDIFWRILEKTKPEYYWDFYKDKAWREFLQRIYRAVRFKEDHVYVMSPDLRILKAVRELQEKS